MIPLYVADLARQHREHTARQRWRVPPSAIVLGAAVLAMLAILSGLAR